MKLPEGKTCGDCGHLKRCEGMFGGDAKYTTCDWAPSKFKQKVIK